MEILEGNIFSSSDEEVQMNTTGIIYFTPITKSSRSQKLANLL